MLVSAVLFVTVVGGGFFLLLTGQDVPLAEFPGGGDNFRNLTVRFVRDVAESHFSGQELQYPDELKIKGNWVANITIYQQGEITGEGSGGGRGKILSSVLEETTIKAIKEGPGLNVEDISESRFMVTFPDEDFSFIEWNGEGHELLGNLVLNRTMDKELLLEKIEQGKDFLLSAVNEEENGFYKRYNTLSDDFGERVHTVYTASIIYTLLRIYDFDEDSRIMEGVPNWAEFLLSMQSREDDKTYGAFHYSYYFDSREKESRFVVGTTALSIFTLLDLYQRTEDTRYLAAAKRGGNWLLTMQNDGGWMKPYKEYRDGKWYNGTQKSLLYNGQVLSALSRLYGVTGEQKYYDTAERIALNFTEKVEEEGCYIGDDYRSENPISSAWVVMSIMDFYKVSPDEYHRDMIFRCSRDILGRQQLDKGSLLYYGTWDDAYSTSGNGWLDEVMMEVYYFSREHDIEGSDDYKEASLRVTWWIIQNTYSNENTFFLKEPKKAIGGSFWNNENLYVRTDSLCHALNAYIYLLNEYDDGLLLTVPEDDFSVILRDLRK
ncbi:pectate lyase [Chloroflexota bacterium]